MSVGRYRPKVVELEAMQIVAGMTTKADILEFCPKASVGAPALPDDEEGMTSTDLRWIVIPVFEAHHEVSGTDWIVKGVTGQYFVRDNETFKETYEEIDNQ
jgi:hypothetical protein